MRPLIFILLALSFTAFAANPPAESVHRMDAAFLDIVFINPEGKAAKLSDYQGKVVMVPCFSSRVRR